MKTLGDLMQHSFHLYGRRNRVFLPSLRSRIDFLNLAVGDLQEVLRKGEGDLALRASLARVVSRIFCIAEHFLDLPLAEMVARKYLADRCTYCLTLPCSCPERRPEAHLQETLSAGAAPSLRGICVHLERVYGARNREKGLEYILNRLFKEVSELISLSMRRWDAHTRIEDIEKEFGLELADALAWTVAVANFATVDLEAAFLERYEKGCGKCRGNPCACIGFSFEPLRWV
jgi:NTP pyrophosphatase (non-canonical NTP hydrolase)